MKRLLFQSGNKTMLWEPSLYRVDWLNACEHCQCSNGIEVTSRSLSGTYLYAGDAVKCPQCGELKVPHQVCGKCGYYKGVEVVKVSKEA